MALLDEVRSQCAEIAAHARWVRIDKEAIADDALLAKLAAPTAEEPALDPVRHHLEGEPAEVWRPASTPARRCHRAAPSARSARARCTPAS
jgi:hypothetical protein